MRCTVWWSAGEPAGARRSRVPRDARHPRTVVPPNPCRISQPRPRPVEVAHEGPHLWSRGCGVHRRVLAVGSGSIRSRGTVPLLVVGGYKIDVRGAALEVLRHRSLRRGRGRRAPTWGAVLVDRDGNEIGRMTGDDFGHRGGDDLEIVRGPLPYPPVGQPGRRDALRRDGTCDRPVRGWGPGHPGRR